MAASLIESFERQHRAQGWDRESYGTHRWSVGAVGTPRLELGIVQAGSHEVIIEGLPSPARRAIGDLPPLSASAGPDTARRVQAAVDRVTPIDGLAESLGYLTRSCHVLAAEPGYDVSHSTPALPLSIFVSIPGASERHAELRLAESIIHEAMHLQLTLIESAVPLVKPTGATAFSPWKQSDRPIGGLMHGLYVFAVIYEALAALAAEDREAREYAKTRHPEIAAEIAAMGDGRDGLTPDGLQLWEKLTSRLGAVEETRQERI